MTWYMAFLIVISVLGLLVFGLCLWGLYELFKWRVSVIRSRDAETHIKEKEARMFTAGHIAGQYDPKTQTTAALLGYTVTKTTGTGAGGHMKAPAQLKPIVPLISTYTQPGFTYSFVGGAQSGKTHQGCHVAHYWQSVGIHPWFIGPKREEWEWQGCRLYWGPDDWDIVAYGLQMLADEATRRRTTTIGHKDHPLLPVFIDDWTDTVNRYEDARQFITSASTMFAAVNIIMYFFVHADTATAYGVEKVGAALKDDFMKLHIIRGVGDDGKINRARTKGFLTLPGTNFNKQRPFDFNPVELNHSQFPAAAQVTQVVHPDYDYIPPAARDVERKPLRRSNIQKRSSLYR